MTDETNQPTDSTPNPQLQLTDILLAAQTIQLASSRGAFRVEEFTQVGGVYERLVGFLKDSGAIQSPAAQPEATAPADSTQGN
jgi:hypothetical protein